MVKARVKALFKANHKCLLNCTFAPLVLVLRFMTLIFMNLNMQVNRISIFIN